MILAIENFIDERDEYRIGLLRGRRTLDTKLVVSLIVIYLAENYNK